MRTHPGSRRFATLITLAAMAAVEFALIVAIVLFIYNILN
jgi:hypothetical protein